ncbi:MAG: DUF4349 domain-containing protein [Ekhidna sp.]|nr:DUF4349 domain-containing protein [Ekhidna sp.]
MKTLTILVMFLMAACGGGNTSSGDSYDLMDAEVSEETVVEDVVFSKSSSRSTSPQAGEIEKKVIKTGALSYKVESTKEEYLRLTELVKKYDGYIASESESKGYDRLNYNLTIKVNPERFDSFISEVVTGHLVESRWINTEDVTSRYYDLQSRIANKQKLEERYQEVLNKATTVKDILEVEQNLNQVRGEIESLQGQFKLLNHQVSYSTLDISFYELVPYEFTQESRPGFGTRLLNSFSAGWQGFQTFLVYILTLWPFGLLAAAIVWLVKKIRSKRKKDDL